LTFLVSYINIRFVDLTNPISRAFSVILEPSTRYKVTLLLELLHQTDSLTVYTSPSSVIPLKATFPISINMPPISGQSILIIGGSSGIGAAAAKLAAAEGVKVSIASSNPTRIANAVKAIEKSVANAKITGYTIDLTSDDVEDLLEKLFSDVTTANGAKLDHIITTANTVNMKPLADVTADYLRDSTKFSLIVPMLIGKLAPRFLNPSYKSSIILTSGRIAEKPVKGYTMGAFRATGLYGLTRALALDLAPLRVNIVSPGATETEMWGDEQQRAQRREMMKNRMLLGKVGDAEEVGEAYIYLMKNSNSTGSVVSSDGGAFVQ
jgi:NAD(P)-dependent dehydrogenase (short-subunit alcohol dehydrogenase family)